MRRKGWSLVAVLGVVWILGSSLLRAEQTRAKTPGAEEARVDRVDLNAASAEELARLPGIGKTVAARIVAYREEKGRFEKVEDIMNVKGIGEKTFTRLQDKLFVEAGPKGKGK